jgi:hypothetical protein
VIGRAGGGCGRKEKIADRIGRRIVSWNQVFG